MTLTPLISLHAQSTATVQRRYTIRDVMEMEEKQPWILRAGEWIGTAAAVSFFFWAPNWFIKGQFNSERTKVTVIQKS